jgi:hypothetical protein
MTRDLPESVPRQHQRAHAGAAARAQAGRVDRGGPFAGPPAVAWLEGGCLCGAVRFAIRGPAEVVHCHCRTCRRISGAAFSTWVSVPAAGFRLLAGRLRTLRTSDRAERGFCPACGSVLTMRYDGGDEVSVTVGALDEAEARDLWPVASIWRAAALGWAMAVDAGLPGWRGDAPCGAAGAPGGPARAAGGTPRGRGERQNASGTFAGGEG